ncbi:unnamed protein product [Soboliphyme baturini]|uniref:Mitochondrial import inner membrane translocase subunit n=1 Tax=Soboliphyme baturini TaxID=241478 RepID=A0A183IV57_9BILA|nr:unnamed protein product [Soboliphyme baturini]
MVTGLSPQSAPTSASAVPSPAAPGSELDLQSFKEFLYQYNRLSQDCFMACVKDFTSKTVSSNEERCALNCLEKFLKMTQRVSTRFQEYQMIQTESANAMAQRGHL